MMCKKFFVAITVHKNPASTYTKLRASSRKNSLGLKNVSLLSIYCLSS
jgi:hypothetical protein